MKMKGSRRKRRKSNVEGQEIKADNLYLILYDLASYKILLHAPHKVKSFFIVPKIRISSLFIISSGTTHRKLICRNQLNLTAHEEQLMSFDTQGVIVRHDCKGTSHDDCLYLLTRQKVHILETCTKSSRFIAHYHGTIFTADLTRMTLIAV